MKMNKHSLDWCECAKDICGSVAELRAGNEKSRTSPASAPEGTEDVIDAVTIALRKAFQLGQTYWQQADKGHISQNKKSDETYSKFLKLSEEISALLTAALTSPVSEDRRCGINA